MTFAMKTKLIIATFLFSICFAQGKEAVSLFNGPAMVAAVIL